MSQNKRERKYNIPKPEFFSKNRCSSEIRAINTYIKKKVKINSMMPRNWKNQKLKKKETLLKFRRGRK